MLKSYTDLFDEIAKQINDEIMYDKDVMKFKFKTNGDLLFDKIINVSVCVITVNNIFKKENKFYPQILLYDCFYECDEDIY